MSGALAESGVVSRMRRCDKHNRDFPQVFWPAIPGVQEAFWAGACEECTRDEGLRQQARQNLPARQSEINRRMKERMARLEKQILKESKQQLEEYLESVRQEVAPQFEAYVRGEHYARELSEVESEIVSEELENLKLKGA